MKQYSLNNGITMINSDKTCPQCEKEEKLCVCTALSPIENKRFVLILRHPQEQDRTLGTARLVTLQLKNSLLKTGLSWPSLTKIIGRPVDPKRWGVLYLGTAKTSAPLPEKLLTVVTKKGEPSPDQQTILKSLEGIILLDGTWAQAKAIWWRNAWLLKCPRLVLQPPKRSLYGHLRKEPRRESVSTIEAAAYTLAALENTPELTDAIIAPFQALLELVRKAEKDKKPTQPKAS